MRAHNFKDLTGQKFGRLTATSFDSAKNGKSWWRCSCECGAEKVVTCGHLVSGLVRSCGCLRRDVAAMNIRKIATKHGICSGGMPRWYQIWLGMIDRCYNPRARPFHRYGGRGLEVCERWHDPKTFLADMGDPPPRMTIERIDNDAGYAPENCRWATKKEQNNNRSTTRRISFGGESISAAAWAERLGISKAAMYYRLRTWTLERALTEAPRRW